MMFIIDASCSMWGSAGKQSKIEAANQVMNKIVPAIPAEVRGGLTAYGHNRKRDCNDIESLVPSVSNDRSVLLNTVMGLQPKGKLSMAAAIQNVADQLENKSGCRVGLNYLAEISR